VAGFLSCDLSQQKQLVSRWFFKHEVKPGKSLDRVVNIPADLVVLSKTS
jgi:hypothetical protein